MGGTAAAILAGAATGVLSGFGVGGGSLLLVYMTAFVGLDQRTAQGVNLLYFIPAAAAALPGHFRNRYIEKGVLLPAILAGLICAWAGAWGAAVLDPALLRKAFGVYLLSIGIRELLTKKRG